jgi:hypothetical protein
VNTVQLDSDATTDPTAAIDTAMAGTEGLDAVPLAEHVARFDEVHGALNHALSSIDTD